jgi:hypothetical protein
MKHGYKMTVHARKRPAKWLGFAVVRGYNRGGAVRWPFMGKRRQTDVRWLDVMLTGKDKEGKQR